MELAWLPAIILRLLVPLLIIPFPLLGGILAILADTVDVIIWEMFGVTNLAEHYNLVDKILDNYMYLFMGIAAWRWINKKARNVALGLLVYRTIGVILFSLLGFRWLMLLFPDIFMFFYIYYLAHIKIFGKDPFVSYKSLLVLTGILAIPKLVQEYLFHIVQFPVYATLRPLIEWVF